MPDCFKASDRSQTLSETDTFKSVAQEQWNGRQDTCSRSDTASKHLPSLSLSEADQVRDLLSKIEKLLTDSQQHSRRQDYGERSNDCSERHSEYGSGRRSEHRSERHRENFSQGGHCRRDSNNSGSRYEDESRGNYGDDSESDYGDHSDAGSGSDYGDSSNNHGSDAGSDNDWPNTDHEPWMPPREEDESIPDYTPPNSSISELTNLSEQLLPVHANGSYPAPAKWESLHSANIQRAKDAAQNGSNMEFFGDSITEALGHDPAAMKPFIDNFGSFKPAALGIGGDGTKQLFYRLNHGEMQGNPNTVVINIGSNDIGGLSTEEIAKNVQRSIESIQLRSPGSKIVLMGILPRTNSGDPGNAGVDATNAALSRLATANGAVQFVNLRNHFVDANGNQKAELYQPDQLHLSPAGYRAWADGLKSSMEQIERVPNKPTVPGENGGPTTLDVKNIRGVNLSGAEWGKNSDSDTQYWPSVEELDYFKSKGMNTVRLMLSWEQLQPKLNGPLNVSEMNRLHQFLRDADERGMKVLVTGGSFARYTLNHGPNGQGADGQVNGTPVGQGGVPISAMQDFWTRMVEHINADPTASRGVGGWDLTNEPHTMSGTWPTIATAVHQAIRNTGDNHTIVVEGDQWARDFRGLEELARKDKNVVFEAHTYWDDGSGGYANPNYPGDPNVGVNHIRSFVEWLHKNDAQGFVGEWGVPTNSTAWAPAIYNFTDFLEENGLGNVVWAGGRAWREDYKLSVQPNGKDRAIMQTIVDANLDN